jgi:transposase
VKNADTAELKGYDAGKKVSGIKRHLAVDTQGLPHALTVTTANVTDRRGGEELLRRHRAQLKSVQTILVDNGYRGDKFANNVNHWLPRVKVQVVKRPNTATFVVLPKRWIVERTFAWLDKHRRLWKNCERLLNSSRQFAFLALLVLLLKRF